MIQTYIYEANAVTLTLITSPFQVVLVYDVTNQASFQDLDDWYNLVKKSFEGKDMPLVILLGNKSDLMHMQAVKPEQHEKFVSAHGLHSQYYVSAKTGDQVSWCFYKVAADLAGIQVSKPMLEAVAS